MDEDILQTQAAYYRARAPEYDDWFDRRGRYDLGPEGNRRWFAQLEEIRHQLARFKPEGDVLELACGTGLWTVELARHADRVVAVDASSEVLEINRARLEETPHRAPVRHVRADLFGWRPDERFDAAFFGFWLSHVPPERFVGFWDLVGSALRPDGRVFFVDSLSAETSTEKERYRRAPEDYSATRRLDDGREFRIVKIFYEPGELSESLRRLGWDVRVETTEHLLYGFGGPIR